MTTAYLGKFASTGDLTSDWDESLHVTWPKYVRTVNQCLLYMCYTDGGKQLQKSNKKQQSFSKIELNIIDKFCNDSDGC